MDKEIKFSPTILIKEKDGSLSTALVVDNGPCLMEILDGNKEYTTVFNELIKSFPSILNVTFYDKSYTNYKVKLEGEDYKSAIKIRKFFMEKL